MGRPRKDGLRLRCRCGIWYATIYSGDNRIERSTGERDEEEAARVARSWQQEAEAESNQPALSTTLNDALAELIDDRRAKVKDGRRSGETVRYYEKRAGSLLAFFGHDFRISAWGKDSKASWDYLRWRRSSKVSDALIKKELGTLRTALYVAQEQGRFSGNPSLAIPASFDPETPVADRSPTREEFLAIVPHLHPDAAAVTAFILATSAEWSALARARRSDVPKKKMKAPWSIHVRGSKTEDRDRTVPIVTDEQVSLLDFAAKHAQGKEGKLFSGLANYTRTMAAACEEASIDSASANDFRHAAGQWLIDVGTPIELVSRFMGHADSRITERVYARVRQEHVGHRMLDALRPEYTRAAQKGRKKGRRVKLLTKIPAPKLPFFYGINGVEKTLSEWARDTGIKKNTLWSRLKAGLSMADAITKGRRGSFQASDTAAKLPRNSGPPAKASARLGNDKNTEKKAVLRVRRGGIEPPTRGFSVPCSTD